jgi:GNAT superfamily N-acetyltransferase
MADYDARTTSRPVVRRAPVRRATVADRDALVRMLARCSPTTRLYRFGGPRRDWPEPFLTSCLDDRSDHTAWVAVDPDDPRRVVALGTLVLPWDAEPGTADLSLLVEDGWQRQGVGGLLLAAILDRARALGVTALDYQVVTDQRWLVGWIGRASTVCRVSSDHDVLHVRAALIPVAAEVA